MIVIKGGRPLSGKIKASGAKNAITKLLIASLISQKKVIFHNVPNILDVNITLSLCKEVGMKFTWDKEKKTLEVQTKHLTNTYISQKFSGANRIPILMLGALLSRTKEKIVVPIVGGDNLGKRSVDFHIKALKALGAKIEYNEEKKQYIAQAKNGLQGTVITLKYPSVGASENSILASIKAKGSTVIQNAAIEPEIMDLILFLQKIGVHIHVGVNRTIYIKESLHFRETEHFTISDRNEIVSYALAAISSKGKIFIENAKHLPMITFLNKIRKVNGDFTVKKEGIEFFYKKPLKGAVHIETDVHPGFMTDWQQPFGVLLTQCKGVSVIHETVYENRFGYTKTLKKMGADIELFTQCLGGKTCRFSKLNHFHSVVIKGKTELKGANIKIPDLRAGFAYIMAAILAKDTSYIKQIHFLERGYENIVQKLQSIGADIKKIEEEKTINHFQKLSLHLIDSFKT